MKKCMICGGRLRSLLKIENMPAGAQNIPDGTELDSDKGIETELCECEDCQLVQLSSGPVSYYRDVIRAGGGSSTMEELRRAQYEDFIELCSLNGKKIIEVGCGQGEFLSVLASYPVKAYGIEHNAGLAKKAKDKGLNVYSGYPETEDCRFPEAPFAAFTSFNFLEHQPEPLKYLRAVYNNLEPEGFGLLTVPSFEYILENNSFYEIIPDHIAYYTMESLEYLMNRAGFSVIKKERVNRDTLSVTVRKEPEGSIGFSEDNAEIANPGTAGSETDKTVKAATDVSGLIDNKEEIQRDIFELISRAENEGKKIAVWGASHQGFTLCSTTGLAGRLEYIIDSAEFKQGRYAPASHIRIVSPKYAYENPADIIIIVAPGYTDEIAGIIRDKFGNRPEIYTMRDSLIRLSV